jgi:hypothetical protein
MAPPPRAQRRHRAPRASACAAGPPRPRKRRAPAAPACLCGWVRLRQAKGDGNNLVGPCRGSHLHAQRQRAARTVSKVIHRQRLHRVRRSGGRAQARALPQPRPLRRHGRRLAPRAGSGPALRRAIARFAKRQIGRQGAVRAPRRRQLAQSLKVLGDLLGSQCRRFGERRDESAGGRAQRLRAHAAGGARVVQREPALPRGA